MCDHVCSHTHLQYTLHTSTYIILKDGISGASTTVFKYTGNSRSPQRVYLTMQPRIRRCYCIPKELKRDHRAVFRCCLALLGACLTFTIKKLTIRRKFQNEATHLPYRILEGLCSSETGHTVIPNLELLNQTRQHVSNIWINNRLFECSCPGIHGL